MPDFEEASNFIKKAIDLASADIPKITVRYIPFCFMKNYEKNVCDFPQIPFDPDEWAPEIQWYSPDFGVFASHETIPRPLKVARFKARLIVLSRINYIDSRWLMEAQKNFFKPHDCENCACKNLCDGLKLGYEKIYPNYRLYPFAGNVVQDPMAFRGPYLINSKSTSSP